MFRFLEFLHQPNVYVDIFVWTVFTKVKRVTNEISVQMHKLRVMSWVNL